MSSTDPVTCVYHPLHGPVLAVLFSRLITLVDWQVLILHYRRVRNII
jgi:hypothetical protein